MENRWEGGCVERKDSNRNMYFLPHLPHSDNSPQQTLANLQIQAIPISVLQYSVQLWLLYRHNRITDTNTSTKSCNAKMWVRESPTPPMDEPIYPALRSFHILSPSGRFDNRSDPGKIIVPINDDFAFKFLKLVNVYLMAALWSSKTIAESPGFSPVLKV